MIEARQDNVQDFRGELLPVMSQTSQRRRLMPGLRGCRPRVARGTGPQFNRLDDRGRLARTRSAPGRGKRRRGQRRLPCQDSDRQEFPSCAASRAPQKDQARRTRACPCHCRQFGCGHPERPRRPQLPKAPKSRAQSDRHRGRRRPHRHRPVDSRQSSSGWRRRPGRCHCGRSYVDATWPQPRHDLDARRADVNVDVGADAHQQRLKRDGTFKRLGNLPVAEFVHRVPVAERVHDARPVGHLGSGRAVDEPVHGLLGRADLAGRNAVDDRGLVAVTVGIPVTDPGELRPHHLLVIAAKGVSPVSAPRHRPTQ